MSNLNQLGLVDSFCSLLCETVRPTDRLITTRGTIRSDCYRSCFGFR